MFEEEMEKTVMNKIERQKYRVSVGRNARKLQEQKREPLMGLASHCRGDLNFPTGLQYPCEKHPQKKQS